MEKSYIKLNDNDNHLSLGNLFRIIKDNAQIKNAALQLELFCAVFDVQDINESTVNNYCTGYRAINDKYKQFYLSLKNKDEDLKKIILKLLSIIEGVVYKETETIDSINKNKILETICLELFSVAKNDISVSSELEKSLNSNLLNKNLYEFICSVLSFVILEKKQPIYEDNLLRLTIEDIINKTYLSINDVSEFLKVSLLEASLSVRSLKTLAKKENAIACFQLGTLEFHGNVVGHPRYITAYNYFETAARKNHPAANWILGYIHSREYPGIEKSDELAWDYFKKAEALGSIAALNSLGLYYLNKKSDIEKSTEYFKAAAESDYVYGYTNLGLIYEKDKKYSEAFEKFLKAASLGESWACNKVGECYRLGIGTEKNIQIAFEFYNKGIENAESEINSWCYYNLAKYFYQNGSKELNLEPNLDKAISYYKESVKLGNNEAQNELSKII